MDSILAAFLGEPTDEEFDVAGFDGWYEALSEDDLRRILASYDEADLFELFLEVQVGSMPPEWHDQIVRAYGAFGVALPEGDAGLGGLDEFGIFGKLSEKFLSDKAKKQIRDQFGRWRDEALKPGTKIYDKYNQQRTVKAKLEAGDKHVDEADEERALPGDLESWKKGGKGLKDIEAIKANLAKRAEQIHGADYKKGRKFGKGTADDPIAVGHDTDRGAKLIMEGKHVRLADDEKFRTVIEKVGELANAPENKEKGFNLCLASVPKSNLFCKIHKGKRRVKMPQAEGVPDDGTPADAIAEYKTEKVKGPDGEDVLDANGKAVVRDVLDEDGNRIKKKVNLLPELKEKLLTGLGYEMRDTRIKASHLAAAQSEVDGRIIADDKKVIRAQQAEARRRIEEHIANATDPAVKAKLQAFHKKMYGDLDKNGKPVEGGDRGDTNLRSRFGDLQEWNTKGNYQPGDDKQTELLKNFVDGGGEGDLEDIVKKATPPARIMVTRDGYIIDGHHRWAAQLAIDAEDGQIGDYDMPVTMVDSEIGEMLALITAYTETVGIPPNLVGHDARTPEQKKADTAKRMVEAEKELRNIIRARSTAVGNPMSPEQVDEFIAKLKHIENPKTKEIMAKAKIHPKVHVLKKRSKAEEDYISETIRKGGIIH
jgi:hypothetical protein